MSIIRVPAFRRKPRGSIQERVAAELKRIDAIRANKAACNHRFAYSPTVQGGICIDCGTRCK